jgi:hypothetical protein
VTTQRRDETALGPAFANLLAGHRACGVGSVMAGANPALFSGSGMAFGGWLAGAI